MYQISIDDGYFNVFECIIIKDELGTLRESKSMIDSFLSLAEANTKINHLRWNRG